jgi:4-amino-4-deoxy-L-arabinose transferase-like glycosyltransferase
MLVIILVPAGLYYLLLISRFPVGYGVDDARFILAAQSLLHGHYINLEIPGGIPTSYPMPGFPLLLAPWVLAVAPHWQWLKVVSFLFTLASIGLLYALVRRTLAKRELAILLLLYAFNPAVAAFSGTVMTEPCFLFTALLVLWLSFPQEGRDHPHHLWIDGALLGWATWIRGEGFILLLAIAVGLAWARKRRDLAFVLSVALPLWALRLARNYWVVGQTTGYEGIFAETRAILAGISSLGVALLHHQRHVLSRFLAENLVPVPATWAPELFRGLRGLVYVVVPIIGIIGIVRAFRDRASPKGLAPAMFVFFVLYVGVHLIWPFSDIRFLLVLVPFGFFFLILGVQAIARGLKMPVLLIGPLLILEVACYAVQARAAVQEALAPPAGNRLPLATFNWIRANTPKQSVILTAIPSTLRLYTGRYAAAGGPARDTAEFCARLSQSHIEFIVFSPVLIIGLDMPNAIDPKTLWSMRYHWVNSTGPSRFRLVYDNPDEFTRIYRREETRHVKS